MASVDETFSRAVKLMFSNEPDAAAQLRAMLDEALMNKYGVCLKLPPEVSGIDSEESCVLNESKNALSKEETHSSSEESNEAVAVNFEDSFSMHLTDLSCVVCGQLNVGARNQLIECSDCQKLYHQDCHSPPIKELIDASSVWVCADCTFHNQAKAKPMMHSGEDISVFNSSSSKLNVDYPAQQSPASLSSPHKSSSNSKSSQLKMKRHSSSHPSSYYKSSSGGNSSRHSR